jgi:hypothetical protein
VSAALDSDTVTEGNRAVFTSLTPQARTGNSKWWCLIGASMWHNAVQYHRHTM